MYKVCIEDDFVLNSSPTLTDAMIFAKGYGKFVIIKGEGIEIAGKFGVDSPPADYEWSKDYSLGRRKQKKVWERNETEEIDR